MAQLERLTARLSQERIARLGAQRKVTALKAELERLQLSGRFRLAEAFARAFRHPFSAVALPIEVFRIVRDARKSPGRTTEPELPAFPEPEPEPPLLPRVASILDPFSNTCFGYEANLLPLRKESWSEDIQRHEPELLFTESAWRGNYGNWTSAMTRFDGEAGKPLKALLEHCRVRGIPTILWNKEDPPNFEMFAKAAVSFDYLFTTDANCIPKYRTLGYPGPIEALPFAAQPRIHNPRRPQGLPLYDVCFPGTWYTQKHPTRGRWLPILLEPAARHGLHIFDRMHGSFDDRYAFPSQYRPFIKGSLEYEYMLSAYRAYKVFLNVNTVTDSPTMFARRVMESLACGTPVISSPSAGMEAMLGDFVRVTRSVKETERHLEELLTDEPMRKRLGHRGYRHVHRHHTYAHRWSRILSVAGVAEPKSQAPETVSVILCAEDTAHLQRGLEAYRAQTHSPKSLIVVADTGILAEKISSLTSGIESCKVLPMESQRPLGDALRAALDHISPGFVHVLDTGADHGAEFLGDLVLAARFSGAAIVGKGAHFVRESEGAGLLLDASAPEHDFATQLPEGSLLIRTSVFDRIELPESAEGVLRQVQVRCLDAGMSLYSADPYNYVRNVTRDPAPWSLDVIPAGQGGAWVSTPRAAGRDSVMI